MIKDEFLWLSEVEAHSFIKKSVKNTLLGGQKPNSNVQIPSAFQISPPEIQNITKCAFVIKDYFLKGW